MNEVVEVGSTVVMLDKDLHHDRMTKIGESVEQTEGGEYLIADEDLAYLLAVGHVLQGFISARENEEQEDEDLELIPGLAH